MIADTTQLRRAVTGSHFWQLFYWLGRASDQLAGVILNPLVVALYARALESDLVRLSWIVSAYTVAWLVGSVVSPWLQQLTVRATPWIVGAYIVRTSAAALLAYAAAERSSPAEQRFRSVLICLAAYALASGVARAAHARQLSITGLDIAPSPKSIQSDLGIAAVLGLSAWAMFEAFSAESLGWSQSFGQAFTLAAVALGVSTLAAVKRSAAQRDIGEARSVAPALDEPPAAERHGGRGKMSVLAIGLMAVSFIEVLVFFELFQDFRRQSTDVRTTMAFFAGGWTVGIVLWGVVIRRYTSSLVLQLSLSCATFVMIAALALRDLSRADWFPDEMLDRDLTVMSIYAVGLVTGLSVSGRRVGALGLIPARWPVTAGTALIALVGAMTPVGFAWLTEQTTLEKALAAGIVLTLLVLILTGAFTDGGTMRRPTVPGRPRPGAFVRH